MGIMERIFMDGWIWTSVLFIFILICSWQIKKRLQREEQEYSPLPETDFMLDYFSYEKKCWHGTFYDETVQKFGLVFNLQDNTIPPQEIRVKIHGMKDGLWQLEAIHLSISNDEVILTEKRREGWRCMFPNKLGIAVPGIVHHTVHMLGKHLRPGKILKVRRLNENNDFEPNDLEPDPT